LRKVVDTDDAKRSLFRAPEGCTSYYEPLAALGSHTDPTKTGGRGRWLALVEAFQATGMPRQTVVRWLGPTGDLRQECAKLAG
jgi:hypothetical protein